MSFTLPEYGYIVLLIHPFLLDRKNNWFAGYFTSLLRVELVFIDIDDFIITSSVPFTLILCTLVKK